MAKAATHSPVKAAAEAAGKSRPTRKSKVAAKRAKRPALQKATDAVSEAGGKAVEAVKSLAHMGEDLVTKVFGGKGSSASKSKAKPNAKATAKPAAAKKKA
jgi:hypothetical protein